MLRRHPLAACALLLAAIILIPLRGALLPGMGLVPADGIFRLPPWKSVYPTAVSNYMLSDQYMTWLPLRHMHYENQRSLRLGLWNPYIACGAPSVGSMQSAPLFPIHFILSWLHPFYSAAPIAFLKLLLAGFFTLLYMRKLSASWPAALLSATAFSLSGFMIVWLGHPHSSCASLLPALLYLIETARVLEPKKSIQPHIGLALAYAAMLLGGHPPSMLLISLAVLAYFIIRLPAGPESRPLPRLALLTASLALGVMLAAPQLLPYLEYYQNSSTALASASMRRWDYHLPLTTAIHFLLPLISGSPAHRYESLGAPLGLVSSPYSNFNERTGYVGVLVLILALAAALFRRGRLVRLHAVAALLCLYVVWGLPPVPALLKELPLLNSVNPTRLLVFACFSAAVLAGLGLDILQDLKKTDIVILISIALLSASSVLFWLWAAFRPYWPQLLGEEKNFLLLQIPWLFAALLIAGAVLMRRNAPWAKPLCIAWTALELIRFGTGYNPVISRERYYPATKAIELLRSDQSLFRVMGLGWAFAPNTGIVYGMQDVRGQDYATVRRYEELISGKAGEFFFYTTATALPPALSLLGVKYVMTDIAWPALGPGWEIIHSEETILYRNKKPAERALVLHDYIVAGTNEALAMARSPGFDHRKFLLLEEEPPAPSDGSAAEGLPAEARITSYQADEVRLSASSPRPGFLLLLDTYFPGWKATVNGQPIAILRADYNFRAVRLPAGRSEVRFFYAPASFRIGASLFLAALLTLVSAGLWLRRRA